MEEERHLQALLRILASWAALEERRRTPRYPAPPPRPSQLPARTRFSLHNPPTPTHPPKIKSSLLLQKDYFLRRPSPPRLCEKDNRLLCQCCWHQPCIIQEAAFPFGGGKLTWTVRFSFYCWPYTPREIRLSGREAAVASSPHPPRRRGDPSAARPARQAGSARAVPLPRARRRSRPEQHPRAPAAPPAALGWRWHGDGQLLLFCEWERSLLISLREKKRPNDNNNKNLQEKKGLLPVVRVKKKKQNTTKLRALPFDSSRYL